jgi:hypothetical protein
MSGKCGTNKGWGGVTGKTGSIDFRARVEDTGPGFNVLARMPKFELTKTLEAVKLNPRTLRPLGTEKRTIPYGAVLEKLTRDCDMQQFHYMNEPYEIPYSDIASALKPLD